MKLPQIQSALNEIADDGAMPVQFKTRIKELSAAISRRKSERRSPSSATVTEELRDAIRDYHQRNPNMTQAAIARHFNVNPGRVSEAVKGFRE